MSFRDGDLVVCMRCGRPSFYRGYQSCPMCYDGSLEKFEGEAAIMAAMEKLREACGGGVVIG